MITKRTYRQLIWIDLESPTQEEIRDIANAYGLHPLVVHELSAPTLKPKVDLYENFIYLILHFPKIRRKNRGGGDEEVDFIVGRKFIITVRYTTSEALHVFAKMFEANAVLNKGSFGPHAGYIFFHLVSKLYESLLHELAAVNEALRGIENRIFRGEEKEMVRALSGVSRDLLDFKRSLSLHRDVLESFEMAGRKLLGDDFGFHLRTLIGDYYRVDNVLESNVAFLAELRETNNSLVSTKQNEIMKTLTILAFIALPATTVLSLFQIESASRPIVGTRFDFWILVLLLIAIALSLYSWFKHKKWL
ncbi:MAG: magnesium transporter [Parcubacteria group bacterium Greene0416_79]|nr:MAG: magnesium transporter [Parcubacteria group bacterium Greene0416_79]